MTNTIQYKAFMLHLPDNFNKDTEFEYLEKTLNNYGIGGYVIAEETEPYIHYHFLVEMTEHDYGLFRKVVMIDKYKLRGLARGGKPRQYGKVTQIDDFDKMLSYTCKDENIRTNLDDETINNAIDKSFKKERPKLLKDKMVKHIDDYFKDSSFNSFYEKRVKLEIIKWMMNNKIDIRKSIIDTYYTYFRQYTTIKKAQYNEVQFFELLYDR